MIFQTKCIPLASCEEIAAMESTLEMRNWGEKDEYNEEVD